MTSLLIPAATAATSFKPAVPALLQLHCTVRTGTSGASPPNPWHPAPWHRWLPWWWFR